MAAGWKLGTLKGKRQVYVSHQSQTHDVHHLSPAAIPGEPRHFVASVDLACILAAIRLPLLLLLPIQQPIHFA